MENLAISLRAVTPFICYIAFGYLARRMRWTDETFLNRLNQFLFRLFFPFLTFYNICQIDETTVFDPKYILVCIGSLALLVVVLLLIVPRLERDNRRTGVVIQAIFRSNIILFALPLVQNLFGEGSSALTAVVVSFTVPIYNVLSVIILQKTCGGSSSGKELVKKVLTNPLVEGAIAGLIYLLLPIQLPTAVMKPIGEFAGLTTPLALFILGGTLHFTEIGKNRRVLGIGLAVKLAVLPALSLLVAHLMGFGPLETFVYFAMFATPVASASFPMAAAMGADGELAGQYVVLSTVASTFTLFLWIFLMKSLAII